MPRLQWVLWWWLSSSWRTVVCSVWLFGLPIDATIRVESTGRSYQSWPDETLGPRLADHQTYRARLQQLKGNAHLCFPPTSSKGGVTWNVTVPSDGSAVALIVKGGKCKNEIKAKHASMYVQPNNVVKFIIIDGGESNENEFFMKSPGTFTIATTSTSSSFDVMAARSVFRRRVNPHFGGNNDDGHVSVVHVTPMAEFELIQLLLREFPTIRDGGGSFVEITGDAPSDSGDDRVTIFWVMLLVVMSVSACICLLNLISNIIESTSDQQTVQRPAPRPRLRQLNPWQVRNNFPIGVFDGTHFHSSTTATRKRKRGHPRVREGEALGHDSSTDPPRIAIDETCTICLDEFEAGDRLRCLPCGHAFHSKCILKWMTERSATCPLCKVDYYESDDDEDEDDDEEIVPAREALTAPLSTSWGSVPSETLNGVVQVEPSRQEGSLEGTPEWRHRPGHALAIWSRSLFRRSRHPGQDANDGGVQASLSEPLLSSVDQAPTEELGVLSTEASDGGAGGGGENSVGGRVEHTSPSAMTSPAPTTAIVTEHEEV